MYKIINGNDIKYESFTMQSDLLRWLKGKQFSYLQFVERNYSRGVIYAVYYVEHVVEKKPSKVGF